MPHPATPADNPDNLNPLDQSDPNIFPATLLGLLQNYSPSGAERPAVDFLVDRMQALGYTQAFIDEAGNAVGVMGDGPRQIILLGHIDTVAGEIPLRVVEVERDGAPGEMVLSDGNVYGPLTPTSPVLYGRGAVDAKGPLAAFVDAVAEIGERSGWQLVVIGAVDEERDSLGALYVRDRYQPEFAIIGEPSGWERITLGYKGSAWAEVKLRLSQAHSASQASSAPEVAIEFWNAVLHLCQSFNLNRERIFDQVTPTLRSFNSGEDSFETWASLRIGVRLPVDLPPDGWYALLERVLALFETYQITVHRTGYAIPAYKADKNTPLVRALLAGIRSAGGEPGFVRKSGTADLNIVAPAWTCPGVAYGPGDSSLDHTPREHIELDEYNRAVRVLVETLKKLCDYNI